MNPSSGEKLQKHTNNICLKESDIRFRNILIDTTFSHERCQMSAIPTIPQSLQLHIVKTTCKLTSEYIRFPKTSTPTIPMPHLHLIVTGLCQWILSYRMLIVPTLKPSLRGDVGRVRLAGSGWPVITWIDVGTGLVTFCTRHSRHTFRNTR